LLDSLIEGTPPGYTPVAFFMTDGKSEGKGAGAELQAVRDKFQNTGFILHTVLITNEEPQSGPDLNFLDDADTSDDEKNEKIY